MIAAADSGSSGSDDEGKEGNRNPILFVEDVESDFQLARHHLARIRLLNPVHRVATVEELGAYMRRSGQFSDLLNAPLPAVVLLDMLLQQTSGVEAIAILRANFHWRKIPVIIFSVPERMATIKTTIELGANAFMLKPFNTEEFCRLAINLRLPLTFETNCPTL